MTPACTCGPLQACVLQARLNRNAHHEAGKVKTHRHQKPNHRRLTPSASCESFSAVEISNISDCTILPMHSSLFYPHPFFFFLQMNTNTQLPLISPACTQDIVLPFIRDTYRARQTAIKTFAAAAAGVGCWSCPAARLAPSAPSSPLPRRCRRRLRCCCCCYCLQYQLLRCPPLAWWCAPIGYSCW